MVLLRKNFEQRLTGRITGTPYCSERIPALEALETALLMTVLVILSILLAPG
jgi:hypothetical protein